MRVRTATAIMLLILATAMGARASSCRDSAGSFDYAGYEPEVELWVGEIATLPTGPIILAGHYHDGARTVHPALLVGGEGGGWMRIPLPFEGAGVAHLTTVGTGTAWAVVQFRQEGLELPESLLRSRDGGRSWCAVSFDGMETLNATESLHFYDLDHGIIIFSEAHFGGGRSVYETSDGGDTWQRLWDINPAAPANIETDYTYPQDEPPPHAPVWRLDADQYRISGVLRIRLDIAHLVIERLEFEFEIGQDWVEIDRIDRYHSTDDMAAGH